MFCILNLYAENEKNMLEKMVSIITINYNGFEDTCELIDSLSENETYPYELIVVDNASEINEAEKLQDIYPKIRVIRSDRNLGFAYKVRDAPKKEQDAGGAHQRTHIVHHFGYGSGIGSKL